MRPSVRRLTAALGLTAAALSGAALLAPNAQAAGLAYTSTTPCDPSYHQVIVGTGPYGTLIYACYK